MAVWCSRSIPKRYPVGFVDEAEIRVLETTYPLHFMYRQLEAEDIQILPKPGWPRRARYGGDVGLLDQPTQLSGPASCRGPRRSPREPDRRRPCRGRSGSRL